MQCGELQARLVLAPACSHFPVHTCGGKHVRLLMSEVIPCESRDGLEEARERLLGRLSLCFLYA
jgi:hypothetical protein